MHPQKINTYVETDAAPRANVYLVQEPGSDRNALVKQIETDGYLLHCYDNIDLFLNKDDYIHTGILILDTILSSTAGLDMTCKLVKQLHPMQVILITELASVKSVVSVMKAGAFDFIQKPLNFEDLLTSVASGLKRNRQHKMIKHCVRSCVDSYKQLTDRERQVLQRIVDGATNKSLAIELGVCIRTIEMHRSKVMKKMQARSLPELMRMVDTIQIHQSIRKVAD